MILFINLIKKCFPFYDMQFPTLTDIHERLKMCYHMSPATHFTHVYTKVIKS